MSPAEKSAEQTLTANCNRIKRLGYITGKHMSLYGEHIVLVSDPFEEGGYIAIRATSGTSPTVRTFDLPVAIMSGWEDLFPTANRPTPGLTTVPASHGTPGPVPAKP